VIENGAGETVMLHEDERMLECVGRRERGAGSFKLLRDVHDDQRLVLDDENRAPL
jgi:hypothetical protein